MILKIIHLLNKIIKIFPFIRKLLYENYDKKVINKLMEHIENFEIENDDESIFNLSDL